MKNLITLLLLVFFLVAVTASFDLGYTGNIVSDNFNARHAVEDMDSTVSDYNKKFENIPRFARTLFGNERINLVVSMDGGSKKDISLITKEGKIISYSKKHLEKPTMLVSTTEKTIDLIASSSNSSDEFARAIKNNDIIVEPKKIVVSVKVFAAKSFIKIRDLF